MEGLLDRLFPVLMLLAFLSPCGAIVSAFVFYRRHRSRVEPHRRVPVLAFALVVIVCGGVAGYLGFVFGIAQACYGPTAPNQCFVWGFFVTGPIGLALGIFAVGLALSLIGLAPESDSNRSS